MKPLSMKMLGVLGTLVFLLITAPVALAQQTATVTGIVGDASGAVLPGVEVTATNTNTGIAISRITTEAGSYTVPALQPGPYRIVASLPGFSDATIQVNLTPNQTFRFNLTLQVGAVSTAVDVVTDTEALLATTTASVGDTLPQLEVFSLPLATRDIFDLLETTAGLVRDEGGDASNFAGTRVSSVNTTRDGVPVSDGRYLDWNGAYSATYSSPDLVDEVQVSVGTVDAAAGRGSSQVRLQTRSGTNDFHGALFWATNNSALNANDWFDNLEGNDPDWTNRQQYGGRLGGPIVRNKAFFFVLIDNQEYRTRENVTSTVLTEQARRGIVRYFPGVQNNDAGSTNPVVDVAGNPLDWTQINGATGPMKMLDLFKDVRDPNRGTGISNNPYIQETLRRMPLPNNFRDGDGLNTAGFNWVRRVSGEDNAAGTSQNTNRKQLNVRIDYQITANNKVGFVMSRERNEQDSSLPGWPDGYYGKAFRWPRIYTAQYTSSISPRVLNEFRFGYRETNWHGRPATTLGCCFGNDQFENLTPEAKELVDNFYPVANGWPYLPAFDSFDDDEWLGNINGMRSQTSPLYFFSDTLSWVSGSHSFSFGWEGNWADSNGWNPFVGSSRMVAEADLGNGAFPLNLRGRFPDLDQNAGLAEDILNDLSGSVSQYDHAYAVNDPSRGFDDFSASPKKQINYHQNDWAAYFKDTWNVTRNLTMNYGVRWDVYGVPWEAKGLATTAKDLNFLGLSGNGDLTQIIAVGKNSPNPDIQLYPKDWNNIAPSFGFSYRVPWLARTTVVRGGYGVSYSGAPTFLQYDFGPAANPGAIGVGRVLNPETYTALPGSTNPNAAQVQFPVPPSPSEPYLTAQLDGSNRNSDSIFVYAADRRIGYIQNMNLSIETEVARNTNLSVGWIGTSGVSLWGGRQLNEPNIFASAQGETFLEAFKVTRGGGNSAMFADMLRGIRLGGGACGPINGTTCTASAALRQSSNTRAMVANGEAAALAEFINQSNIGTGQFGGLLRTNGYPENFMKLNPQFDQVDYYDNGDHSTYHALQARLTKRLSSGFSSQFTYTWSKALGNSATEGFRAREDQSFGTRDPNNRNLQKGVVGFHRSHQFNAHGVWNLPFGPGRLLLSGAPNWVHRLVEGWQLSSIFSWNSGTPLDLVAGAGGFSPQLRTLVGQDVRNTPNLVGNFPKSTGEVVVGDGTVQYLEGFSRVEAPVENYYGANPDRLQRFDNLWQIVDSSGNVVLSPPEPGTTGNLSNGWLTGPGRLGLDVALSKSVQLREGTNLTIRVDAVNVLNKPQWGTPNTNLFSTNFGRITTASGERQFTMNARIEF